MRWKIRKITGNTGLKYCNLTFLWVNNQVTQTSFNTSQSTKLEKVLNSGKVYSSVKFQS